MTIVDELRHLEGIKGNFMITKNVVGEGVRSLSITAENTDDGQSVVNIKDSGIGIDMEILPKLFEKFASKSYHGTGLGLFISKNIVEAHGGRIWAKNNQNESGASFSFSLPIAIAKNSSR
jgi:signal transduction histidine kinase